MSNRKIAVTLTAEQWNLVVDVFEYLQDVTILRMMDADEEKQNRYKQGILARNEILEEILEQTDSE